MQGIAMAANAQLLHPAPSMLAIQTYVAAVQGCGSHCHELADKCEVVRVT
jgi:hypothetical protein